MATNEGGSFSDRTDRLAKKTMAELVAMQQAIQDDPKNQLERGSSLYKYTKSARQKLDDIAWAITYKLQGKRRGESLMANEALRGAVKAEVRRLMEGRTGEAAMDAGIKRDMLALTQSLSKAHREFGNISYAARKQKAMSDATKSGIDRDMQEGMRLVGQAQEKLNNWIA